MADNNIPTVPNFLAISVQVDVSRGISFAPLEYGQSVLFVGHNENAMKPAEDEARADGNERVIRVGTTKPHGDLFTVSAHGEPGEYVVTAHTSRLYSARHNTNNKSKLRVGVYPFSNEIKVMASDVTVHLIRYQLSTVRLSTVRADRPSSDNTVVLKTAVLSFTGDFAMPIKIRRVEIWRGEDRVAIFAKIRNHETFTDDVFELRLLNGLFTITCPGDTDLDGLAVKIRTNFGTFRPALVIESPDDSGSGSSSSSSSSSHSK